MSEIIGNKKASIILPVYNGEQYISKAIESVLEQTYSNLELIIVNDCSTDKTAEIVSRYAEQDSRIKVINNPVNLKLPNTLNVGFEQATGDYYTWTSDDNLYKENAIERMVYTLNSRPDIDMVYADFTIIDSEGEEISVSPTHWREPDKLLFSNMIGACFLYTREVAEKVGKYDANLFLAEDYDYWIRIFRVGKMTHLTENLYYYRQHAESLTETKKELIYIQTYRVLEKNFLFLYSLTKNRKDRHMFFNQLFNLLGDRDISETRAMLKKIDNGYFIYKRIKGIMKQIMKRHYDRSGE